VTRSISPEVHYGILSALICTDVLDASSLDTIARIVTTRPGYIYLNRLLLKSTKTHSSTVEYILNNNRISWDIRVEKRYKALAKQRLVLAEKGT